MSASQTAERTQAPWKVDGPELREIASAVFQETGVSVTPDDPLVVAISLHRWLIAKSSREIGTAAGKAASEAARHEVARQLNQIDGSIVDRLNEGSAALDQNIKAAIDEGTKQLRAAVSATADDSLGRLSATVGRFEGMMNRVQWALFIILGALAVGIVLGVGIAIGRLV